MTGMDRETGKPLTTLEHIEQCLRDVLSTPVGTRLMRRDYGSRVFELLGKPMTSTWRIELFAAVNDAIRKWEPRFIPELISLEEETELKNGRVVFSLRGKLKETGQVARFRVEI